MANTNNSFDFNAFNGLTGRVPTGMKVFLALQLLKDAVVSLERFENPLESDLRGIVTDLKDFRTSYKADSAARAEKKGMLAADGQSE